MVGGRRPLVEDEIRWKTASVGRQPLVEADLWWKTPFGGRRPLVGENLWWKTTFSGRRPSISMEDYLLVEDNPCMLPRLLWGIFEVVYDFFTICL